MEDEELCDWIFNPASQFPFTTGTLVHLGWPYLKSFQTRWAMKIVPYESGCAGWFYRVGSAELREGEVRSVADKLVIRLHFSLATIQQVQLILISD